MEETFAQHYARTGDATYAATKAGYSNPQPRGSENAHDPAIIARASQIRRAKLAQASIEAVDTLVDGMRDAKAPRQARNTAAGLILKYAVGDDGGSEAKDPHEMSSDEIARALQAAKLRAEALESVKADRSRPILDNEPDDAGIMG
jgi:hypothetical protein